jgi:hypothetical protein
MCPDDPNKLKCDNCVTCAAARDWPLRLSQCREDADSVQCQDAKTKYTHPNIVCDNDRSSFSCILIDLKRRHEKECQSVQAETKKRIPKHVEATFTLPLVASQNFSGYKMHIPMYTLETETTIGLAVKKVTNALLSDVIPLTMILSCSPSGLTFARDGVEISFPVSGVLDPETLKVYYLPVDGMPVPQTTTYDAATQTLKAKVTHFSDFVAGRRVPQVTKQDPPPPKQETRDMRVISVAASVGAFLIACFFACMCLSSSRNQTHFRAGEVQYYVMPDDVYGKIA